MSNHEKQSAKIIPFPMARKRDVGTDNKILDALASALNDIEQAPDITDRIKSIAHPATQQITGNNNTQIASTAAAVQTIEGNDNVQINGPIEQLTLKAPKKVKTVIAPSPGSIGANGSLKLRIETLIKGIEQYRKQRLGTSFRPGVIHGELAKAFGLKKSDWLQIYLWDESRADELLSWLENKLDNTQQGRINKAYRNEGARHTRGHLFSLEKAYVEQLG